MTNLDKQIGPVENFYKRLEPHENDEAAHAAFNKFLEGVYALANKHRITEVLIAANLRVKTADPADHAMTFSTAQIGSDLGAIDLAIVAAGYGRKTQEKREKSLTNCGAVGVVPELAAPPADSAESHRARTELLIKVLADPNITDEDILRAGDLLNDRKEQRRKAQQGKTGG